MTDAEHRMLERLSRCGGMASRWNLRGLRLPDIVALERLILDGLVEELDDMLHVTPAGIVAMQQEAS